MVIKPEKGIELLAAISFSHQIESSHMHRSVGRWYQRAVEKV